jgi:hypothetical protein
LPTPNGDGRQKHAKDGDDDDGDTGNAKDDRGENDDDDNDDDDDNYDEDDDDPNPSRLSAPSLSPSPASLRLWLSFSSSESNCKNSSLGQSLCNVLFLSLNTSCVTSIGRISIAFLICFPIGFAILSQASLVISSLCPSPTEISPHLGDSVLLAETLYLRACGVYGIA